MSKSRAVEAMKKQFAHNVATKPWGWEWKFTVAKNLLSWGRTPQFVRKVLGLTYPWMFRHGLLQWIDVKNDKGEVIYKRMVQCS